MEIQEYVDEKKNLYSLLLTFIQNDKLINRDFHRLIQFIETQDFEENEEELTNFLRLILKVTNNHHRSPDFFQKIEKILIYFENIIKQTLNNFEIYDIFKQNKRILLFLISKNIIKLDKSIANRIIERSNQKVNYFSHFFYPEIKPFIDSETIEKIESEFSSFDPSVHHNFDKKRQIGENDSYICSLIRQDSVEKFISFVNSTNLPLSSKIKRSIFETNSFLQKNEPTLIEYAAFFGSIQIFQFLLLNNVELNPSLWFYAIHSKNAELIHLLEENFIEPENKMYEKCFEEAIKCHHNEIANYFENVYTVDLSNEKVVEFIFRYYNYSYFPIDFSHNYEFFYLCKYSYFTIVKLFLEIKKNYIKSMIIQTLKFFNEI